MNKTAFLVEAVNILGVYTVCVVDRQTQKEALRLLSRDRKFKVRGESVFWDGDKICLLKEVVIKK